MLLRFTLFLYFFNLLLPHSISQTSWNVDLFGHADRGDGRYSGSWCYVAPDGSEYALLGAKTGTAAYSIDDPDHIEELGFVPGPVTNWREITAIGHYAYVVTDVQGTGHSMQVIDLSYLPDSLHLVTKYTETFTDGHIIQKAIGSEEPYVYVMGTSTTQGVHILDVSDPANPLEIGLYAPGYYIHDAHIRGNLLFGAAFYEGFVDIVDITDKTNPFLIGRIEYQGGNTHSSSTTEDGKYLILADEHDGYPARIFNITDIENPIEVAQYTANSASLVHNPYIRGDYAFISHNTEGLRVLDIADPELPVEIGYYDTWPGPSGGFSGLWSACPYFPSGKIIGGNRTDGLYIWTFNNARAARIYGLVTDSLTTLPLTGATVKILPAAETLNTDLNGNFKKGMLAGTYSLEVSAPGYQTRYLDIVLAQGDSLWLEIPLSGENVNSVKEKKEAVKRLNVFPNPFSQSTMVALNEFTSGTKVLIINDIGTVLRAYNVARINILEIQSNELASGKYWLLLLNDRNKLLATARIVRMD